MGTERNCNKGSVAGVQTLNPDCDCVGIASITQSSDLTRMYINLTNGQTDTFTLPTGGQGERGASGTSLIWSDGEDHATTTTTWETLSEFSTDHTNEALNLVNVGDTIKLYSAYALRDNPTATGIGARYVINGTGLSNIVLNNYTTTKADSGLIELLTEIILVDNTAGAMYIRVNSTVNIYKSLGGLAYSFDSSLKILITNAGGTGVSFSANDYTISAQADSEDIGDITLQIYQAEKLTVTT